MFYWINNLEMILCVKCIVDFGFLNKIGIDLSGIVCEDVIGICRRMYVLCFVGYIQFGLEFLICILDGYWKYNIYCEGFYNNII